MPIAIDIHMVWFGSTQKVRPVLKQVALTMVDLAYKTLSPRAVRLFHDYFSITWFNSLWDHIWHVTCAHVDVIDVFFILYEHMSQSHPLMCVIHLVSTLCLSVFVTLRLSIILIFLPKSSWAILSDWVGHILRINQSFGCLYWAFETWGIVSQDFVLPMPSLLKGKKLKKKGKWKKNWKCE